MGVTMAPVVGIGLLSGVDAVGGEAHVVTSLRSRLSRGFARPRRVTTRQGSATPGLVSLSRTDAIGRAIGCEAIEPNS